MQRTLRRLATVPFTLLFAITLTFLVLRLTPGDPAQIILGEYATEEAAAALRTKLGLDQPLYVQYWDYVSSIAMGDFGRSLANDRPILPELLHVFPYTIQLAVAAMIVAVALGIPLGILAGIRRNTPLDRTITTVSLIGISTPVFVLGFLLLLLFSYQLKMLPMIGEGIPGDPVSTLKHLILPALTLGLVTCAPIINLTRSGMVQVLNKDYIRTARGKGLMQRSIIFHHAFRNTLVSIVSLIGLQLTALLGGTVITEMVFSRQGIGQLLVNGILARDYPMVQGVLVLFLCLVIAVNLIVDILYSSLDPRLK